MHSRKQFEVQCQTNQPLLTEIIQAQYLTLFGHIARMDDNVDAKQILTSSPSVYWKRPPGRPRMTWMKTVQMTPTGCRGLTQSIWPRTDHSGGCWQPVVLRTRSGASRRRRWLALYNIAAVIQQLVFRDNLGKPVLESQTIFTLLQQGRFEVMLVRTGTLKCAMFCT